MVRELSDIIERVLFDPNVIDLVVWFPHLSWRQFAMSTAAVLAWRFVADRLEAFAIHHLRRVAAWVLFRLALFVRP